MGDREPPHGDAADPIGAFRILVLPGDVVARTGREDVHVVAERHPFGDETAVVLGSAENLRAVALDDERNPHHCTVDRYAAPNVSFVVVVVRIAVLGARSAPRRCSLQPRALQDITGRDLGWREGW
jgi:hypothetical protein